MIKMKKARQSLSIVYFTRDDNTKFPTDYLNEYEQ